MGKHSAKLAITSSKLEQAFKIRALYLLDNPDDLNQTFFGVCGVVSLLQIALRYDPDKFAKVAIAAGTDTGLGSWRKVYMDQLNKLPTKKLRMLYRHAKLDFLMSQYLLRRLDPKTHVIITEWRHEQAYETSYKLETTTEELSILSAKEMLKHQRAFSDLFQNEDASLANWEQDGHFALTQTGVNFLMVHVLSPAHCEKIAWSLSFKPSLDRINQLIRGKKTPFVLAGIKDALGACWNDGSVTDTPAKTPAHDEPKFGHWVVVESIKEVGEYYQLEIWTWASRRTIKFRKVVMRGYIYGFVAGHMID